MSMEFKKNQRVRERGGADYRVEAGPYRNRGGEWYVLEKLSGVHVGDYTTGMADNLSPMPPVKGDKGRIRVAPGGPREFHPYSPHEWIYGDDSVILLRDRNGNYDTFSGQDRQHVLDGWESVE